MLFNIGPKNHKSVQPELKQLIEGFFSLQNWKGLWLTGGTCLAEYYFGHRQSDDMDLFTQDEHLFAEAGRALLISADKIMGKGRQGRTSRIEEIRKTSYIQQFHCHFSHLQEPIKIDLVLDLPIRLAPPIPFGSVWLDSLEDILCNKMGCLISRNAVKDLLDLYYLAPASHSTTKELIEIGLKKEGGLDPLIMANQIEWIFGQPPPAASLLGKTDWTELKLFFKKFQKECLDLIRP